MAMGYTNRNFMEQPPRIQPPFTAPAASNILGSSMYIMPAFVWREH